MTDIARPSNPALSFSSFNDEPVSYRMTAYPDRIEILAPSPRTTITSTSPLEDDGRSKSAPPLPAHAQEEKQKNESNLVTSLLSSTYSNPPDHSLHRQSVASNGRWQTLRECDQRNPESLPHVLRTLGNENFRTDDAITSRAENLNVMNTAEDPRRLNDHRQHTGPQPQEGFSSPNTPPINDPIRSLDASTHSSRTQSYSSLQRQEELVKQQADGRELRRPVAQSARPFTSNHGGGGTLILRPNPVVIKATTSHISAQNQLVRAATSAVSEQTEELSAKNHRKIHSLPTTHTTAERGDKATEERKVSRVPSEEKKVGESWCEKATREAESAKELKRKKKEEIQKRKHESQVDFPEENTLVMPSTAGVRVGEANDYAADGNPSKNPKQFREGEDEAARTRQTQQQQNYHRDRMNSLRASSGGASMANHNHLNNGDIQHEGVSSRSIQPTPLFERLVTEEVQELKTYAGIVERQNQELAKQKKIQEDLESRLRAEARKRKELESLLEEQERLWSEKFMELEELRSRAEKKLEDEQTKTAKLINQVQRKDRDIHDFFKKKVSSKDKTPYDFCARSISPHHCSCFSVQSRRRTVGPWTRRTRLPLRKEYGRISECRKNCRKPRTKST